MAFQISYACVSHVGRRRKTNQDNFVCDGFYMQPDDEKRSVFRAGTVCAHRALFGVFDGMGGEERGEAASWIAASRAAGADLALPPQAALERICTRANLDICAFAARSGLAACGTTAAMLLFAGGSATLCNLGDSKIFRLAGRQAVQLSVDHVTCAPYGHKPPLLQYLGIRPDEMHLRPSFLSRPCRAGDRYLICSDGLSDMLPPDEIGRAAQGPPDQAAQALLSQALERGGRDNITLILLEVGGPGEGLLASMQSFLRRKQNVTGN